MTNRSTYIREVNRGRCAPGIALMLTLCAPHTGRAQSSEAPLRITPESAVSLALEHNLALESARRTPEIAEADVRASESVWTPSIVATLGHGRTESPASNSLDRTLGVLTDRRLSSDVTLSQRLPWGAAYDVGWSSLRRSNNSALSLFQPELDAAASASVTQPLLRGFGIDSFRADRARSLQARDRAGFELDGTVAGLKREVLYAYWQWVYTREFRGVAKEALELARTLLEGNRERVAARAMAAADVIEAEAEVARRDEAVIIAEKNAANAEDRLRLLIVNPRSPEYLRPLEPADLPASDIAAASADPAGRALMERRDLRILKSAIDTSALNVRQRRNDVLPDVNLTAGFSAQGLGGTELIREGGFGTPVTSSLDRGLGVVLADLGRLRYPGWSLQLSVGYPIGSALARANSARAQVEKRQQELSLEALEQQVATEVRAAQREVDTDGKRLQSTATAVLLAERRLAAEEEKFLVGLSTSFFVFQAQRDLASARVARLGAILDRRLSLVDLETVQSAPLIPLR